MTWSKVVRGTQACLVGWGFALLPIGASPSAASAANPDPAIQKAMAAVESAILQAQSDPGRPIFHFLPPAQWMNDPNGVMQVGDTYHLFYQHNPYADRWDTMHWGHAISRDLVHWEHWPIALAPSYDRGEGHCFSGSGKVRKDGTPVLFYTSISKDGNATEASSQWMAVSHDGLETWEKPEANPILDSSLHGDTRIWDWRDPYLFTDEGETYLVTGGNLNHAEGGQAIVGIYRATDENLTEWEYLGILFQHPDSDIKNIECPNFFKLGDRWVLLISPHGLIEYFVGDFDKANHAFHSKSRGIVDAGAPFYAPNTLLDDQGRWIEWGWIRGFAPGKGWNGCLTLPRILSLDEENRLVQTPASELVALRGNNLALSRLDLASGTATIDWEGKAELEAEWTVTLGPSGMATLHFLNADSGEELSRVSVKRYSLVAGNATAERPQGRAQGSEVFRVFLDRTVLEVYTPEGGCATSLVPYQGGPIRIVLSVEGESTKVDSLSLWEMNSIWNP